jgi:hypothetical protein
MSAGLGEIRIQSLKVGGVDLNSQQAASYGFEIFENIFSSYGPGAQITTVDHTDAVSQLKGGEDSEIKFTDANGGGTVGFKFKAYMNKNLTDGASEGQGALKSKKYTLRLVSMEALNAQGKYVDKAWEDKTTNISKDILQNYYKTDKPIEIDEDAKDTRTFRAHNEHPKDVVQKLNDEHVGSKSKSSAFCVYQEHDNGNQKYKIATFEGLFEKPSVGKWAQRADLSSSSASDADRQNSIMWFNAGESFNMALDHTKTAKEQSFNMSTHSPTDVKPKNNEYKTLGTPPRSEAKYAEEVPVNKSVSMVNEKQRTEASTAKANKYQFLSYLSENSATFEIIGNSKVKLGSIMEIDLPKRTEFGGGKERQFNGKVCVVEIKHKIRPAGQVPRYTMVIRAVKAAYEG